MSEPTDAPGHGARYEELIDRAAAARVPLTVLAELTYRCVFRCRHCHVWPRAAVGRELPTAAWLRILGELAEAGTLFLTFSGGEPFLRPDLFELIDAAVSRGFSLTLFTGGYLLDPEAAARVAGAGVAAVEVSFYSSRPEVYEAVTEVSGSWTRVTENIRRLRDSGVPVMLKTPVMRTNYRALSETYRWAQDEGFLFRADFTLFPDDSPAECNRDEILGEAELEEALRLAAPYCPPLRPSPSRPADTLCSAGHRFCTIDPAGRLYACSCLPEPAGDLTRASFAQVWRDSPVLAEFRKLTRSVWQRCWNCELEGICRRCPALSCLTGGGADRISDALCGQARARARAAGGKGER